LASSRSDTSIRSCISFRESVFTDTVPATFGQNGGVPTTLHDNEQYGPSIPGVPTTAGWDLTTGFGSPKAAAFVAALAAVQ
jgi:hypothetical protein